MKQILFAVAVLGIASSAPAATIVLQFDQPSYPVGDTVSLSIIATANSGETGVAVFGELVFTGGFLVGPVVRTQTPLESVGGAVIWDLGSTPCTASGETTRCTAMNQLAMPSTGVPHAVTNTPLVIATVTFQAFPAYINVSFDETTFDFFGAPQPAGACVAILTLEENQHPCPIIPEPSTAALLGLGLVGLAARRLRA